MPELNQTPTIKTPHIEYISLQVIKSIHRTHQILDYIKNHPNTTPYEISKDLGITYTCVSNTINDLEYCKLIAIRVVVSNENRTQKQVYIPELNKQEDSK
ncbi:MAG: helix-turn-helix domain-containing protein [archaeon]